MRQAAANFFLRLGLRIQGVPYKPAVPGLHRNALEAFRRGELRPFGRSAALRPESTYEQHLPGQGRPVTSTTPPTSTTQPKPPPPPLVNPHAFASDLQTMPDPYEQTKAAKGLPTRQMEAEADEDFRTGRFKTYTTGEAFLRDLDA